MPPGLTFNKPACEQGCRPCQAYCAILPARIEWWTQEQARVEGLMLVSADPDLQRQLASAQEALAELARQVAASPRVSH